MRPTNLRFRSPKEKTPGPYVFSTSNRGTEIFSPSGNLSFFKGQRFTQYESEMKRTGPKVGPGSYHTPTARANIAPVLRPACHVPYKQTEACMYVGDQIVIDPDLRRQRPLSARRQESKPLQRQRTRRKQSRPFLSHTTSTATKSRLSTILKTTHSQIAQHLRTLVI